jgi:type 1 glutamine amidotransferase
MSDKNILKRRGFLQAGAATITAAAVPASVHAALKPKQPGETKVVCVMGDYYHSALGQETEVRRIFESKKDWRIIFVRASRFFTPELISDADLLIIARYGGRDSAQWNDQPLADSMEQGDMFWTDEQNAAIIDNVKNRGMGFMGIHCTIACRKESILSLLGVQFQMHDEIQPLWVRDLNQEHPITRGIKPFYINIDEQFGAFIRSASTTQLFGTTAIHNKRERNGGWCLDQGKGRVVGLLPGHLVYAYRPPEYQEIFWRAAHWAMKRQIPAYPKAKRA